MSCISESTHKNDIRISSEEEATLEAKIKEMASRWRRPGSIFQNNLITNFRYPKQRGEIISTYLHGPKSDFSIKLLENCVGADELSIPGFNE